MADNRDRQAILQRRLAWLEVPGLGLHLHLAHPRSRLAALTDAPPYWAYVWAGGLALALHLRATGLARGRRVLDLGAGSGVVGILAALEGAAEVTAVEPDPWGRAAIAINAAAHGVALSRAGGNPDLVLCGDVFYSAGVAAAVLPVLDGWRARGVEVLVGDPGRADLPLQALSLLARYPVADVGEAARTRPAGVYAYRPDARPGGDPGAIPGPDATP
ncbi:MAG: 50S ribosomal protein L11 methyltransferase [Paracoccaceae bacterium]